MINKDLKRRILEISFNKKLAHLGSCLTAVDIIDEIFAKKKSEDHFVLSSGHAGLALYVVLEKYNHPEYGKSAGEMFEHHGVHPDRCADCGIEVSTGSLGQGLPIAVGMAFGDRTHDVYCLISDGEMAEGSIYEALRIANQYALTNLHVYINNNGFAAYQTTGEYPINLPVDLCWHNVNWNVRDTVNEFPFLKGQNAHYHVMSEEDYKVGVELCK